MLGLGVSLLISMTFRSHTHLPNMRISSSIFPSPGLLPPFLPRDAASPCTRERELLGLNRPLAYLAETRELTREPFTMAHTRLSRACPTGERVHGWAAAAQFGPLCWGRLLPYAPLGARKPPPHISLILPEPRVFTTPRTSRTGVT